MTTTLRTVFLACLLLAGCTPTLPHTRADRDTFDDIAPRYVAYLNADQSLDEADRATYLRTVQVWELRVVSAEQAAGVESPPRITKQN